jgi:iron complex outermembrane receptor protein
VYVCPITAAGTAAVCDATNGVLNPNNPFAASGQTAQVSYRMPVPRQAEVETESFRYAAGIAGSFGSDDSPWDYSVDFLYSKIEQLMTRSGYPIPNRVLNVIYDGSFNFVDPRLNTESTWNYIAPPRETDNESELMQIQATLSRALVDLPGGELIGAVGLAYREEEVSQPSANGYAPDPFDRYLSMNAVGAKGDRDVKSAFFEIDAPVLESLTVNLSGRYDDYSTGQDNFSPKIGVQWQVIDMLRVRGTYSEGFRIASFNEAFGEPTTGYISTGIDSTTPEGAAFIAAHGDNAYVNGTYSLGLTATGNSALDPEESESYTFGVVFEPDWEFGDLSLTVDFWHIEVDKLISGADYAPAIDAYYQNNGVVNLPGIVVVPAAPDPEFPNALPLLGFIQYSYQNADSEVAEGIDIGVNFTKVFDNFVFNSHLELSHLQELSKTIGGIKYDYEGTLSPCDVTSCSGAPDWRATWVNSIEWRQFTFALTMNYTGDYSNASVDYGADPGDCSTSIYASTYAYDDGSPFKCDHDEYVDFDFTASYRLNDKIELYANVLNVFDDEPEFDPASAYHLYGFNPSWELNGWRGRYIRVGARMEF